MIIYKIVKAVCLLSLVHQIIEILNLFRVTTSMLGNKIRILKRIKEDLTCFSRIFYPERGNFKQKDI